MTQNTRVEMYTSSLCGFCYKAKSLLKNRNITFDEINIDFEYENKKEMINRSKGKTTVPQIFFGNIHIGGYDDLLKLDRSNKLENL